MKRSKGWGWTGFFHFTKSAYRAQHAGRTIRAIASGNPNRILKLYTRRFLYRGFAQFVNRLLR
jgi:hypothetical protein